MGLGRKLAQKNWEMLTMADKKKEEQKEAPTDGA